MNFEKHTYHIADHYLPYLINGDASGLSDEDEPLLDQFEASLPEGPAHWSPGEPSGFRHCAISGLLANCSETNYMVRV